VAVYTATEYANLMTPVSSWTAEQREAYALFVNRALATLQLKATVRYEAAPNNSAEGLFIRNLLDNPVGTANGALYAVLAVADVVSVSAYPTDSELATAVDVAWNALAGA
jgi:hypothetical protein